jgi:hypothetical protein
MCAMLFSDTNRSIKLFVFFSCMGTDLGMQTLKNNLKLRLQLVLLLIFKHVDLIERDLYKI